MIKNKQPDIVFLDVELDDGLSFEILRAFPIPNFVVVFCTAFEHYAMKAIRMSALDFLLKPIATEEFIEVVNKLHIQLAQNQQFKAQAKLLENLHLPSQEQKLVLKDTQHWYFLYPEDIFYIQAEGRYSYFFAETLPEKIMISQNLRVYEVLLESKYFYRCHHSYLVNLKKIAQVDKANALLYLTNGASIPMSKRKKEGLMEKIKEIVI